MSLASLSSDPRLSGDVNETEESPRASKSTAEGTSIGGRRQVASFDPEGERGRRKGERRGAKGQ